MKTRNALAVMLLLGASTAAFADVPTDSKLVEIIGLSMQRVATDILPLAIRWLALFMLIQFTVTNLVQLSRGADLSAIWGKFLGSLLWFGFCWYAMTEGPDFLKNVGTEFFAKFAPDLPSPTSIFVASTGTATGLLVLAAAVGVASDVVAQFLLYMMFAVLGIGLFFGTKLILLQLELGLIVMMAPFNFAFLGLNATKDQGIAPFKSLMSFMFKVVIFGILYGAFAYVSNSVSQLVSKQASLADPLAIMTTGWSAFETLIAGLVSYVVLFVLLIKSDSIAASLSSGTTNLGADSAVGAMMAAGAGGAVVNSLATSAVNAKPGMADFVKKLAESVTGGAKGKPTANAAPDKSNFRNAGDVAPPPPPNQQEGKQPDGQRQQRHAAGEQAAKVVHDAGGPAAAAKAAGEAAAAGTDASGVASAVLEAGGTRAQATGAAVASQLAAAGASPEVVKAGADAALGGGSGSAVNQVVQDAAAAGGLAPAEASALGEKASAALSDAASAPTPYEGTPNPLEQPRRDEKRDADRQARRDASAKAKASPGGIGGTAPAPAARTFGDHMGNLNQQLQENATVSVSINANADS